MDSQGTNAKTDDLMEKLLSRSNSPCITYLFVFFTERTNTQKFQTETSTGLLLDSVVGRPGDQIMKRSRYVRGTSIKHVFEI